MDRKKCGLCGPCPKCRRHVEREGTKHREGCPDSMYIPSCKKPARHWVRDPKLSFRLPLCDYHFARDQRWREKERMQKKKIETSAERDERRTKQLLSAIDSIADSMDRMASAFERNARVAEQTEQALKVMMKAAGVKITDSKRRVKTRRAPAKG